MDCSLPGSFVHGIVQARVLEWGAIALSGDKARYGLSSGMNRHLTLLSMQHFPLSLTVVFHVWKLWPTHGCVSPQSSSSYETHNQWRGEFWFTNKYEKFKVHVNHFYALTYFLFIPSWWLLLTVQENMSSALEYRKYLHYVSSIHIWKLLLLLLSCFSGVRICAIP